MTCLDANVGNASDAWCNVTTACCTVVVDVVPAEVFMTRNMKQPQTEHKPGDMNRREQDGVIIERLPKPQGVDGQQLDDLKL